MLMLYISIGGTKKAKFLFLAPQTTKLGLHWWSQSNNFLLLSYRAQAKIVVHGSSNVKKKKKFIVFTLVVRLFIVFTMWIYYFIVLKAKIKPLVLNVL